MTPLPKVLKYNSFIFPLGEISHKDKKRIAIIHEKKTHLANNCVTMTYLMVKFDEMTELNDVICEECSKSSGKTSTYNFEKNNQYKNHQCI